MTLTGNYKNTRSRQSRTRPGRPGGCRGTPQKSQRGVAPAPAGEKSPLAQTKTSTPLAPHLSAFFEQRLPVERGASENTRDSYAYAFQLLLTFASKRLQLTPSQLSVEQIDAPLVLDFLNDLETTRGNGPSSRNIRLAAIKSFMHFLEYRVPLVIEQIRRVLAIPIKKAESKLVSHLTAEEVQALLDAPDPAGWKGIRDRAMLHLCYAGGLRVSELIGLPLDNVRLQPRPSVLVHGKGRRERCLPLWRTTTAALRAWLAVRGTVSVPELFVNARGESLTRSGFEYILRKHFRTARQHCPSLAARRVHPHVLRHTCALTVLQATKDLRKVSLWLGHAQTQTTEMYTRVDPSVKLEALESVVPPRLRSGRFKATDKLLASLRAATVMQSKKPSK
jgi:site-specific recombinase XerD